MLALTVPTQTHPGLTAGGVQGDPAASGDVASTIRHGHDAGAGQKRGWQLSWGVLAWVTCHEQR